MSILSSLVPATLHKPLKACRGHIMMAAGYSALVNILYLAPTIYMMQVYDRVVPTGGLPTLYWLTLVVGISIAVLTALDSLRAHLLIRASMRLDRLLAPMLLERSFLRRSAGSSAVTDDVMRQFDIFRQTLSGPALLAFFDVPWTPFYVFIAFIIHPILGMIVIAGGAVLVALAIANQRRARRGADRAQEATASAYANMQATVREAELVRALGMRRAMVARHVEGRRAGFGATVDMQIGGSRYNSLVKFFRMFMQSLALGTGAFLAVKGQISSGAIIAASVLLSRALQPVEQLVGSWSAIVQAKQAMRTVDVVIEGASATETRRTALPAPEGHVALEGASVRSSDGVGLILNSVSLQLAAGQVLGVIGPSGAGKTTLARILSGAVVPDAGEVRLDGANMADRDQDELAAFIGYMPQSCALLPGTISENISRFALCGGGNPEAVDTAVVRAARRAGVHELILKLPHGYDSPVGPGGHPLSAGQTQRLALARALYGDPPLLVLDEPNSALDAQGEEILNRVIAEAKSAGATIIVVAHRTLALASADVLAVLFDGVLAHFGPKDDVLRELAEKAKQSNVVRMQERA
jgi:PrtD family type I secretion system ABC transporter